MKKDLQPFNNIEKDLLFWIKEYLAFKALEFFENSSSNTVDDIIASIELIKDSNSIDEVKNNSNLLVRDGLGSMSRVNNATYKLYIYSVGKIDSIKDIDTNLLQDFKDWLTIGSATKKGYIDSILELCELISRTNSEKYTLDVEKSIVRVSKKSIKRKMIDVMSDSEYEQFSKMLTKYKYKNEYEKARAVLMCRIFLFSGITTTELLNLELGKSFIIDSKSILIKLENRKRDIDLPRSLIISHFNKYKELSLKEKEHDISHKPLFSISKQSVNNIVKNLLEYANIKREPLTPQLIRYSFFVYIYNKRCTENEITFNTIHDISGIVNKEELRRILNTFDKDTVSIAKVFDKEKF
jgi:hypothetical protein